MEIGSTTCVAVSFDIVPLRSNAGMSTHSFHTRSVYLPTFCARERPAAALATLMEPRKRTFAYYTTGRDETFEGRSGGRAAARHSIRDAIVRGFVEYDYLRGDEPYKYSFGCNERRYSPFS